jgi:GT2 family glycosyltransferase
MDEALSYARRYGSLASVTLILVHNGPKTADFHEWQPLLDQWIKQADRVKLLGNHGNIGYGAGHNLAINSVKSDFHLVLNPDVLLEKDALLHACEFMVSYPEVGLLTPSARDRQGHSQYLCKRYPTLLDLLLRGFAPGFLKQFFQKRLHDYELRDKVGNAVMWDVPIVSGCFMLFRQSALRRLGGFSPSYFLYFEDFDISLRAAKIARTVYVPSVRITHYGGHAARKGWRHIALFSRSALAFFKNHGWKWV